MVWGTCSSCQQRRQLPASCLNGVCTKCCAYRDNAMDCRKHRKNKSHVFLDITTRPLSPLSNTRRVRNGQLARRQAAENRRTYDERNRMTSNPQPPTTPTQPQQPTQPMQPLQPPTTPMRLPIAQNFNQSISKERFRAIVENIMSGQPYDISLPDHDHYVDDDGPSDTLSLHEIDSDDLEEESETSSMRDFIDDEGIDDDEGSETDSIVFVKHVPKPTESISIDTDNTSTSKTLSADAECQICMSNKKNVVWVPCGHSTCSVCKDTLVKTHGLKCTYCNKVATQIIKLYL